MMPVYHQWHLGHFEDGRLGVVLGARPLLFLGDTVLGSAPKEGSVILAGLLT